MTSSREESFRVLTKIWEFCVMLIILVWSEKVGSLKDNKDLTPLGFLSCEMLS